MTTLLWCLVAATTLPYAAHAAVVAAKARSGRYDNHDPRAQSASLEGFGRRAWAAQANAWEALAVFAPLALIHHLVAGDTPIGSALGAVWLAARLGHLAAYLADVPIVRSTAFTVAWGCALGLIVTAATGIA